MHTYVYVHKYNISILTLLIEYIICNILLSAYSYLPLS